MALDSFQKRMSAIHLGLPFRGVPVDAGETDFTVGNRQAAAGLYSGISAGTVTLLDFVQDYNTRLWVFLGDFYGFSDSPDLTTMIERYLREECTGNYNVRWQKLLRDATEAMGG